VNGSANLMMMAWAPLVGFVGFGGFVVASCAGL